MQQQVCNLHLGTICEPCSAQVQVAYLLLHPAPTCAADCNLHCVVVVVVVVVVVIYIIYTTPSATRVFALVDGRKITTSASC